MPLKALRLAVWFLLLPALLIVSGCGSSAGFPPLADLNAVTSAKPVPGDDIVTDPVADAKYNAALETWGDKKHSAGIRLCKFFKTLGMAVDCPTD